jgi:adenylate cyclase
MAKVTLLDWAVGLIVMSLAALDFGVDFACDVAVTIALAGITTTASAYLLAERSTRPLMALVLDGAAPEVRSLGIGPRLLLTWLLCSAVPVLMIALIPTGRLPDDPAGLVAPIVFASAVALGAGALGTKLATLAVTQPLRSLRAGLDAVAAGDLDVRVPVDDGSEIGRLQARFNSMVDGLRERERLQDLLGRHAGAEVAREMLEQDPALGGQECCVSILFVDLVGSTALAHTQPPERVVALLNRFFQTVVDVVHEHGGLVNKFEGDAALCVFGAPVEQADHAAQALRAARRLRMRLRAMDGVLDAAISVACGTVVAGYVGAEERFEYTVIGDPVNEACRLSELAKRHPSRLLTSGDTVREAGPVEQEHWQLDGEVLLRGRPVPTQLAVLGVPASLAPA